METNKYYFTFGFGHAHSVNGRTYDKDTVVEITAVTDAEARNIMVDSFGQKWCMQYSNLEEVQMQYYPKGVIKLNGF